MVQKILTLIPLLTASSLILPGRAFIPPVSRPLSPAVPRKSAPASRASAGRFDECAATSEESPASDRSATRSSRRGVASVEKFARLPIWPVWQGVILFLASKVFGPEVAAQWEDAVGGRVCPNFFSSSPAVKNTFDGGTSPFVLLVHHRHAFMNWDPIRYIQRTFFPEGFPAHPHRGFVTVTYILRGGFFHRDSLGIKQSYGAEERHDGRHVQWLTAGSGIQHEEMWDLTEPDEADRGKLLWTSSQELYQIWLNLPAAHKMSSPDAKILRAYSFNSSPTIPPIPADTTPIIVSEDGSTVTTVICGAHNGIRAPVECPTDASIIGIQFTGEDASTWTHVLPSTHETAILYVRNGSIHVDDQRIPPHHTVYLTSHGEQLVIQSLEGEADVLLLSGAPLREPISSQGSMVMNTQGEIQKAYMDYERGFMGVPWDHNLDDEEWEEHIRKNPSMC